MLLSLYLYHHSFFKGFVSLISFWKVLTLHFLANVLNIVYSHFYFSFVKSLSSYQGLHNEAVPPHTEGNFQAGESLKAFSDLVGPFLVLRNGLSSHHCFHLISLLQAPGLCRSSLTLLRPSRQGGSSPTYLQGSHPPSFWGSLRELSPRGFASPSA